MSKIEWYVWYTILWIGFTISIWPLDLKHYFATLFFCAMIMLAGAARMKIEDNEDCGGCCCKKDHEDKSE